MLYFQVSKCSVLASGLCGMTGCQLNGKVGRGAACALLSLILLSLSCSLSFPGFSFLNLSTQPVSGIWMVGVLPAQCAWLLQSTMGGYFELGWVGESSWVWDRAQAPWHFQCDTCLQALAAEGKKEGVCVKVSFGVPDLTILCSGSCRKQHKYGLPLGHGISKEVRGIRE